MVETLRIFSDEVTRVAREVGTEGKLGGQARVAAVDGTWRSLRDSVNTMALNLTNQVRAIAYVTVRGSLLLWRQELMPNYRLPSRKGTLPKRSRSWPLGKFSSSPVP